ncbi:RING finger protein 227 [Mastacembelus armatus]|uniref:Si:ch73-335l21.4 n=1 Tax=Mastacembelus armatus TaxID=205130 RepID=A0A3Q3RL74_9TELE|nr:RING finger protein 227-like [Mastacembelus armatus]
MYSELDCGICYRTFNAGRRCPRELHCKHSFCESCLLVLSRPPGPDDAPPADRCHIVCPLCRQTTSISSERTVRVALRVDECVLERLLAAGAPDQDDDDEEEDGEPKEEEGGDDSEEATRLETPAEESDSSAGTRGGSLRRSWKKVWRKIVGKGTRRGGENCMTSADLRNLALMSCYVF